MNNYLISALIAFIPAMAAGNPVVLPAGDFRCEVKVIRRDSPEPDPSKAIRRPLLTSIHITRVADATEYVLTWSDGDKTLAWRDNASGRGVEQHRNGDLFVNTDGRMQLPQLAMLTPESVSWIRSQDLQGEENLYGFHCLHYRREMIFPQDQKAIYQAWIEKKSGVIVALDDEAATYTLSFAKEPPTGPLEMPQAFKKELDRYAKAFQPPRHL